MTLKIFRENIRNAEMLEYCLSNTRTLSVNTTNCFMANTACHPSEIEKTKANSLETCNR